MTSGRQFRLITTMFCLSFATSCLRAAAVSPQFGFTPDEFQQSFNATSQRNHCDLNLLETRTVGSSRQFKIGQGIQISAFIDRSSGHVRSLTLAYLGQLNHDYLKCLPSIICLVDSIDPTLAGKGRADLFMQLGLNHQLGQEALPDSRTERNGTGYRVWTSADGKNIFFSANASSQSAAQNRISASIPRSTSSNGRVTATGAAKYNDPFSQLADAPTQSAQMQTTPAPGHTQAKADTSAEKVLQEALTELDAVESKKPSSSIEQAEILKERDRLYLVVGRCYENCGDPEMAVTYYDIYNGRNGPFQELNQKIMELRVMMMQHPESNHHQEVKLRVHDSRSHPGGGFWPAP